MAAGVRLTVNTSKNVNATSNCFNENLFLFYDIYSIEKLDFKLVHFSNKLFQIINGSEYENL